MSVPRPAESPAVHEDVTERLARVSGEEVWHYIENGLDRIMYEPSWGTDIPSLVGLYTAVHDFCTSQRTIRPEAVSLNTSQRGAHLLGEDLYRELEEYLRLYLVQLKQRLGPASGERLLNRYLNECAHYTNAAQIINYLFRYLNRHWIKREQDEGKLDTYDIYSLHLILWHRHVFTELSDALVDAVSELVDEYRTGKSRFSGTSRAFIEFAVSFEPDGTNLSGSVRNLYGALLESPWRIALQESDCFNPPTFLYDIPVTALVRTNGLSTTEIEERLASLVFHSGSTNPSTDDKDETGSVKLLTGNNVLIEVDQSTAECSFLIKRLCAYFGRTIIDREVIPLPNVKEKVLRKVLVWCERHKNDPDIAIIDVRHRHSSDMDIWDQEYFQIETEQLFEVILAANYLDIGPLVGSSTQAVANLIKGKTPDEIRTTFGITNDFTPEEEDQIRREQEWSEDRSYLQ